MGQATKVWHHRCCQDNRWSAPKQKDDLSRSLVAFDQNSTLVAVAELSLKTWLVGGLVPGLTRQPLKKQGADPDALAVLLHRWRDEAIKAGCKITRIVVAFEADRDGFGLRAGCSLAGSKLM
jgi:transposase